MTTKELQKHLIHRFPIENEQWEWKEFSHLKHNLKGKEGEDIISYISAISNMKGGSLIIGVKDKTLEITGIQDFYNYTAENIKKSLLETCTNLSSEGLTVTEYITTDTNKIVWVIDIPKHQPRLPVYAHKKLWQRVGDSLVEMRKERLKVILDETVIIDDWSAGIIEDANVTDLDENAILKARKEFIIRNPKYTDEIEQWDNTTFLNKAKLTINGKITNTAMILLGKDESEHYINPSVAKIRWLLRTLTNQDKDFEIFGMPLILTVDDVLVKIRNLKYRYLRDGTLFPHEMLRYEPFSIRELLNNAIAHQDYTKSARINLVEFEDDHLVFTNYGTFIPESVESVVLKDAPEEYYRNLFLVEAMKNLNMIDTQGGGIRKIFNYQRKRFFPMPDYDFNDGKVKVTLTGKIIDENFAKILINNPELNLEDIITLDKVQKNIDIEEAQFLYLRKNKFIEGRKPKIYLSYKVIKPTENEDLMADYVKNKSFDDEYFKKLIVEYIKKQGKTSRKAINKLIIPKLSAVLDEEQKKNKITNFLSTLRMQGKIKSIPGYFWEIV
ncbi:MAG: putative DNA binding domain-containing protein [Marinilabiliaceae bacterium]|nr:putative DNA binding domain-containing protein [Marinilabiliaceae bacterium]